MVSWIRRTFVRASSTQLPVVESKPLVLKASEFQHLFEDGPTEKVYTNTPLAGLGQAQQGMMVEAWVRKVLQEKNPEMEILDPEPGLRRNGSLRGRHQAEYDFLMGGRRVEIKSSRIVWTSTTGPWSVDFPGIKLAYGERKGSAFDDLYLVIMSPKSMRLIRHDLVTGVSKRGNTTAASGHRIMVRGSMHTDCWEDSLDEILQKLCEQGGCSVVLEQPFRKLDLSQILKERVSRGQAAVSGLPMSSMSREKRGNRIQEIGFAIDRRLHPDSDFSFAEGTRGKANAPVDWIRGVKRVELKSCLLTFHQTKNRWWCRFQCIKPNLFDELWLGIYCSVGIHYYRLKCRNSPDFGNTGGVTNRHGRLLAFFGPQGELDPLEALKAIQAKMMSRGCELVAFVYWEKGPSTPHHGEAKSRWGLMSPLPPPSV